MNDHQLFQHEVLDGEVLSLLTRLQCRPPKSLFLILVLLGEAGQTMEGSKLFQHPCNFDQFLPRHLKGSLKLQQLHSQFFLIHHPRTPPYYQSKSRCFFDLSGLFLKISRGTNDPEQIHSKIGSRTRHQMLLQFEKFLSKLAQI